MIDTTQRFGIWIAARRDRFGLLLVFLVLAFLLTGVSTDQQIVHWAAAACYGGALVMGMVSTGLVGLRPRLAVLAGLGLAGSFLVGVASEGEWTAVAAAGCQITVLGVLVVSVIARVLEHRQVRLPTLLGAISAYLLIGMSFAWMFEFIEEISGSEVLVPSENGAPVYYSFTVLTTLGFGDITPQDELVRRVTTLEAVIGQVFLATLVARLVAMYGREASETPSTD